MVKSDQLQEYLDSGRSEAMHRLVLMLANLVHHHCCAELGLRLPGGTAVAKVVVK